MNLTGFFHHFKHPVCAVTGIFIWFFAFEQAAKSTEPRWESAITAFERDDQQKTYPSDAILFVGSSSIRLWNTLAEDMAPHPIIQRGFGGAKMIDVLKYLDRILGKHSPPALVLFVANDITGNTTTDLTPGNAAQQFVVFTERVLQLLPNTEILIVAVTPTPRRWRAWPQIQALNSRLIAFCESVDRVTFIPTASLFLGSDGLPRSNLFREDKLHLSADGYRIWTTQIRRFLEPVIEQGR